MTRLAGTGKVKFEAWLEAGEAQTVQQAMVAAGYAGKAEYVRACLRAGPAPRDMRLAALIGHLGLAINDLSLLIKAGGTPEALAIPHLLSQCRSTLRRLNRRLNAGQD